MSKFSSDKNDPTLRILDYIDYTGKQVALNSDNYITNALAIGNRAFSKAEQNLATFPSDVLAYYDFSNPENIGYDYSGRGQHLSSPYGGITVVSDKQRTYALDVNKFLDVSPISSTPAILRARNSDLATSLRSTTLTNAFWIYPRGGSLAHIWNTIDVSTGANTVGAISNTQTMLFVSGGGTTLNLQTKVNNTTTYSAGLNALVPNKWNHVCITTSTANKTKWYINGVFMTNGETRTWDMSTNSTATTFTIGALRSTNTYLQGAAIDQYTGFNGTFKLSDMIFLNRELTASEVLSMYNDDYGYDVFPIAGQSNGAGAAPIEIGVDDDYSIIEGKVFAYKTNTNIDSSGNVAMSTIVAATDPLPHPTTVAGCTGFWLQFSRDIVQFSNRPFRRKLLVVPVSVAGSIMNSWNPVDGINYVRSVSAIRDALNVNKLNKLQAYLWNQGESEITGLNLNYKTQLLAMITGYQSVIPQFGSLLPKVMAEVSSGYYDPYFNGLTHMKTYVKSQMLEICDADPSWHYIFTSDLTFAGNLHYDAVSYRKLGARYADEYISILGTANLKPPTQLVRKTITTLTDPYTVEYTASVTLKTITPNITIFCNMTTAAFTLTLPLPSALPSGTKFTIVAYQTASGSTGKVLTLACVSGNRFRNKSLEGANTSTFVFPATADTYRIVAYNNTYYIS